MLNPRSAICAFVVALATLKQGHAQTLSTATIYEKLLQVRSEECRKFSEESLRQMDSARFGPHQQEIFRSQFSGICYSAMNGMPEQIDDLLQTGRVSLDFFQKCLVSVERGGFKGPRFELQRLFVCVTQTKSVRP